MPYLWWTPKLLNTQKLVEQLLCRLQAICHAIGAPLFGVQVVEQL
jgi:hypothetical protein